MTSGRETLHSIDAAIADARRALSRASNTAAADARSLAEFDREEMEIYGVIASIRLQHLKDDESNAGALGRADRDAEALIAAHDDHLQQAERDAANAKAEIERLEADRRQAELVHDGAIRDHDAAAAATRARLDQDAEYQGRAAAVEEANAVAERARQKLEVARTDREEKGASYEADPLFSYLHNRDFGTRSYRAFPLFALLDGWVAGVIRYQPNKLNYDRLLELPERLGEHAERLASLAASAEEALEGYERAALNADGVDARRDEVAAAAARLEQIDRDIDAAESRHRSLAAELAAIAGGEAGPLSQARELVAAALARRTVPDLKLLAAETATPEDDRLVDQLVRLKRERMELEEARRAAARSLDRYGKSLSELEDIRRRFKSARYDSPYSEFSGRDFIGGMIAEFLRGALTRDDFWRRIERSHRTRRRDWDSDFGGDEWRDVFGLPDNWGSSGPFGGEMRGGKSRGPTTIRIPRAPRAPRPPRIRIPSGGGRKGGGGFRTGGGF